MFFEGAYEGWRYDKPTLTLNLVPTTQQLAGDFSNSAWSFYQHQMYNPYSTASSGGKCTVQPFKCDASGFPITPINNVQTGGSPCLKIPPSMLNPAMLAYVKAYYLPPNTQVNEPSGYNFIENRPHPLQGICGATPIGKRGSNGFCEFNPAVFSSPSGAFGNMGKMAYQAPYSNNLDFSLVKETPLYENLNLEIRAEAFNVYNVMIMGNPGTTIGNSSAGLATGISNTPRELRLGAKLVF